LRRTITVERPLEKEPADKNLRRVLAVALSGALDEAIDEIVKAVVPKLSLTPSAAPPGESTDGGLDHVSLRR
jgi:hypothetical protein